MARFVMPGSIVAAASAAAIIVLPAAAAPTGAVPGGAPKLPASVKVPLGAKLDRCVRRGPSGRRFAWFIGAMPAIDGASRLQMRFDLFSRPDIGGLWSPVREVPTFGSWFESDPGAPGLRLKKKVFLNQGLAYRVTVSYRWLSGSGDVVRSASRSSGACTQPDPRPDLAVAAGGSGDSIVVVVRNAGRSAPAFDLRLSSGGRQLATRHLDGLRAGRAEALAFAGSTCEPGSTVSILADPRREITERREDNNAVELRCPASSG